MRKTAAGLAVLVLLALVVALVGCAAECPECGACPPCPACPECPDCAVVENSPYAVERIGIDSRDDSKLYNGADFYMYSDDHSTQKAHIDGATGNVDVEGTLDVNSTVVFGTDDLYPLGFDGSTQYEFYFGNAASVTNTVVDSDTHGMTTAVDWAVCWVSDPDADANDPFLCVPSLSGTAATMQAVDDDGDSATTAATKLYYMIIGR